MQKSVDAIAQVMLPACTKNSSADEWDWYAVGRPSQAFSG